MTPLPRLAAAIAAVFTLGFLPAGQAAAADPHAGHGKATAAKTAAKPDATKPAKRAKAPVMAGHGAKHGQMGGMHAMMSKHHGKGHSAALHKQMMGKMAAHHGRMGHGMMKGGMMKGGMMKPGMMKPGMKMQGHGGMHRCGG